LAPLVKASGCPPNRVNPNPTGLGYRSPMTYEAEMQKVLNDA
jgi:hypothetical protein